VSALKYRQRQCTTEIFEERKQFFRQLFVSSGLSEVRHKVVHVTGTKGKGSTVEYISSALRSDNKRVATFTSPHLHTARERIKIGKTLISREQMIELGNQALESMKSCQWTMFFDLLLTVALSYFGKNSKDIDYIILEAGIGGRYDSTNFFANPAAVVITSISLDHQAVLGSTVEEIAWQKAGIIKKNCHVFTPADQPESVLEVLRKQSREVNATLHEVVTERSS
jgi:dihydrofolate synthase/folylpolyglutamate synthase